MGKARQKVDQSVSNVRTAVSTLQQALVAAEKAENKTIIENAISSLNSTCQNLNDFQD